MSIKRQSGMTLAELLVAMVVIAIGLAGVLTAFSVVVKDSADPLIRKQMLSIAEETMEEITLQPFAVSGAPPGNATVDCTSGAPAGARRADFDDLSDYNGYSTTGICNIDGESIASLAAYGLSVAVTPAAAMGLGAGNVNRIDVQVSHGTDTLQLVGWRINYAPP